MMSSYQTGKFDAGTNYAYGYRDFFFPFILAVLVLYMRGSQPGVTTDGAVYLQISRNILLTKELGWQAGMFLPFHSILIASVSFLFHIHDLLAATGIVVHMMFILLVTGVYALALNVFDRKTAIIAAIISASFPHLITIANSSEPEITYSFFLILALLLFILSIKRNSYFLAGLTGIFFSLAYLTRSESFVVMSAIFFFSTVIQGKKFYRTAVFRFSLIATLTFFITAMPYLLSIHNYYGKFVLHPKATNVMLIVNWHVPYNNPEEISYGELWRMNDGGKFFWQEPKGAGDLMKLFIKYPRESMEYYLKSFARQIPGNIPNGSGMENFPQVFPVYLVVAALFAFRWSDWGTFAGEKKCLLLAPFLILFTLPLLGGWWKYMAPYLPILIIIASRGLVNIASELSSRFSRINIINPGNVFLYAAILALVIRFTIALSPFETPKPSLRTVSRATYSEEIKKVGVWASQRFEPGKNYMLQWSKLIYFLNGTWTPDPLAETADIIRFAKKNGVDFYVKEITDPNISLIDIKTPPNGIEFVDMYESNDRTYKVAFYRLRDS